MAISSPQVVQGNNSNFLDAAQFGAQLVQFGLQLQQRKREQQAAGVFALMKERADITPDKWRGFAQNEENHPLIYAYTSALGLNKKEADQYIEGLASGLVTPNMEAQTALATHMNLPGAPQGQVAVQGQTTDTQTPTAGAQSTSVPIKVSELTSEGATTTTTSGGGKTPEEQGPPVPDYAYRVLQDEFDKRRKVPIGQAGVGIRTDQQILNDIKRDLDQGKLLGSLAQENRMQAWQQFVTGLDVVAQDQQQTVERTIYSNEYKTVERTGATIDPDRNMLVLNLQNYRSSGYVNEDDQKTFKWERGKEFTEKIGRIYGYENAQAFEQQLAELNPELRDAWKKEHPDWSFFQWLHSGKTAPKDESLELTMMTKPGNAFDAGVRNLVGGPASSAARLVDQIERDRAAMEPIADINARMEAGHVPPAEWNAWVKHNQRSWRNLGSLGKEISKDPAAFAAYRRWHEEQTIRIGGVWDETKSWNENYRANVEALRETLMPNELALAIAQAEVARAFKGEELELDRLRTEAYVMATKVQALQAQASIPGALSPSKILDYLQAETNRYYDEIVRMQKEYNKGFDELYADENRHGKARYPGFRQAANGYWRAVMAANEMFAQIAGDDEELKKRFGEMFPLEPYDYTFRYGPGPIKWGARTEPGFIMPRPGGGSESVVTPSALTAAAAAVSRKYED